MRNLLYKEFTLSIHPFFYWMLPFLLSLLFLIPNWIYSLVFMYFFWISVPQIFQGYTAQQDSAFLSTLPVSKKSIVYSKILAVIILELIHLLFGAVTAAVHVGLYGSANFAFDVNPALFGTVFIVFGSFNLVFLPGYFRTAFRYGIPLILGVIVTLIVASAFELGTIFIPWMNSFMERSSALIQIAIFLGGAAVFAGMSFLSARLSYMNYRRNN